jgi:hypothetical protein
MPLMEDGNNGDSPQQSVRSRRVTIQPSKSFIAELESQKSSKPEEKPRNDISDDEDDLSDTSLHFLKDHARSNTTVNSAHHTATNSIYPDPISGRNIPHQAHRHTAKHPLKAKRNKYDSRIVTIVPPLKLYAFLGVIFAIMNIYGLLRSLGATVSIAAQYSIGTPAQVWIGHIVAVIEIVLSFSLLLSRKRSDTLAILWFYLGLQILGAISVFQLAFRSGSLFNTTILIECFWIGFTVFVMRSVSAL